MPEIKAIKTKPLGIHLTLISLQITGANTNHYKR